MAVLRDLDCKLVIRNLDCEKWYLMTLPPELQVIPFWYGKMVHLPSTATAVDDERVVLMVRLPTDSGSIQLHLTRYGDSTRVDYPFIPVEVFAEQFSTQGHYEWVDKSCDLYSNVAFMNDAVTRLFKNMATLGIGPRQMHEGVRICELHSRDVSFQQTDTFWDDKFFEQVLVFDMMALLSARRFFGRRFMESRAIVHVQEYVPPPPGIREEIHRRRFRTLPARWNDTENKPFTLSHIIALDEEFAIPNNSAASDKSLYILAMHVLVTFDDELAQFISQGLNYAHCKLFSKKRSFNEVQTRLQKNRNYTTVHAVVTLIRTMVLSVTSWGRFSVLDSANDIESALALFKFLEKIASQNYAEDVELVSRLLLHEKWSDDYLFANPGNWRNDPDRYLISWKRVVSAGTYGTHPVLNPDGNRATFLTRVMSTLALT